MSNIKNQITEFLKETFREIVKKWIILAISTIGFVVSWRSLWEIDLNIRALWLIILLLLCFIFGFILGKPKKIKKRRYLEEHSGFMWEVYEDYKGHPYPEVKKRPHCKACGAEFIFESAYSYPCNTTQIRCPNPQCKKIYQATHGQIEKLREEVEKIVEARSRGYLKKN